MFIVVISIIIILSVLLILVILGQNSKGGVGAAFGGSASQVMGVTKTGNILEKATWVLAICILVLSLVSSALYTTNSPSYTSPNIENAARQVITPSFDGSESLLPQEGETTPEEGETAPSEADTSGNGE